MSPWEPPGAKRRDQAVFDKLVSSSVPVLKLSPRRPCRKARPRGLAHPYGSPAMRGHASGASATPSLNPNRKGCCCCGPVELVGERPASVGNAVGDALASSTACPHVPEGAGRPEGLVHKSTGPPGTGTGRRPGLASAPALISRPRRCRRASTSRAARTGSRHGRDGQVSRRRLSAPRSADASRPRAAAR